MKTRRRTVDASDPNQFKVIDAENGRVLVTYKNPVTCFPGEIVKVATIIKNINFTPLPREGYTIGKIQWILLQN